MVYGCSSTSLTPPYALHIQQYAVLYYPQNSSFGNQYSKVSSLQS